MRVLIGSESCRAIKTVSQAVLTILLLDIVLLAIRYRFFVIHSLEGTFRNFELRM